MPAPSASVQTRHGLYGGARRLYGTFTGKSSSGATALATSLTAFWPLDESSGNALDSHTNSLDLTDQGTVGTNATGSPGGARCRVFDETNSEHFERADESLLRFGDQDWSVATWFYTDGLASANVPSGIIFKNDDSAREEFWSYISTTGGAMVVQSFDGTSTVAYTAPPGAVLSATTWHSFVVTFDATANEMKTYTDGVLRATDSTEATTPGTSTAPFWLGRTRAATGYLSGRMSATAKWGRTLDADDVTTWHNGGSELDYTDIVPASPATFPPNSLMLMGTGA